MQGIYSGCGATGAVSPVGRGRIVVVHCIGDSSLPCQFTCQLTHAAIADQGLCFYTVLLSKDGSFSEMFWKKHSWHCSRLATRWQSDRHGGVASGKGVPGCCFQGASTSQIWHPDRGQNTSNR